MADKIIPQDRVTTTGTTVKVIWCNPFETARYWMQRCLEIMAKEGEDG